jgi:hypothetical protein
MPRHFTAPQHRAALTTLQEARGASGLLSVAGSIRVALNQVYEEIHQHRVYEVYPVTILREMVLHGNGGAFEFGPAFVPVAELEATAPLWNNVPVLVNHPDEWSLGTERRVIDASGLGFLSYPWINEANELRAELWIDKEIAEQHERWVDIKLQAADGTLEMSTGYLIINNEEKSGSFKGAEYESIHHGIIPLHLALLPDAVGACSVADGCGMNTARNESGRILGILQKFGVKLDHVINKTEEGSEMTPEQKLLMAALQEHFGLNTEEATKLATNCDCKEITVKITNGIDALATNAGKLAGVEAELLAAKAALQAIQDQTAAQAAAKRKKFLDALNMSDDNPETAAIPSASLAFLAKAQGITLEGTVDMTAAANAAGATSGKTEVQIPPADTMPKDKGAGK